ncbi:acyltransferase [Mucilaginibacter sp. dw_454]|uniref:acyltransferase family protein n=1 Tax=Mucilaginibacter sp. dw_454 TaxID=2720079 RepID=UPI001BD39633|nr:acyltransferase [Mucilaginibacter sp. dw_454]
MKPPSTPTPDISDKHKLLGLDHLRAFAICYVVLFHYRQFGHPDWVNKLGDFGWTGVDLFFVLSGFLIAGQLFATIAKGKPISLKEFFTKRFFRIIPPYLVMLCLYIAFPVLRERDHMAPLWRYLTFTTNFGLDVSHIGTFTHSWSLCVEEQFYLVLPLIILLLSYLKAGKKAAYLILVLFLCGFAIRYMNWQLWMAPNLKSDNFGALFNEFIYYPTYNRLDALLAGVSIAGLYNFYPNIRDWINKRSNIIMVAGVLLLIPACFICTPQATFRTTIWGYPLIAISYGLIVAAIVCPANVFYDVKSWLTRQIAMLSYGIYLTHKLIIHLTQHLLDKTGMDKNSNVMMLCSIVCCIAGALVLRYVIEKPSLRIRDKVLGR